ncbi:MAG: alpha-amylase family glycosyl hydrolase [Ferruginibacter sp.]
MYDHQLYKQLENILAAQAVDIHTKDQLMHARFLSNIPIIRLLYNEIYEHHPKAEELFDKMIVCVTTSYINRSAQLKKKDLQKLKEEGWFLSNQLAGMSLYVDRFCGNLPSLQAKLDYFKTLGVNLLHLMPVFESPKGESDGGYAVSDFRKVDDRFGTLSQLKTLQQKMIKENMHLMIDIVLNHTSQQHEWAQKAKQGEQEYQDYFYMYSDRSIPDEFERAMPEVFPESSPGNFTYVRECNKWVMTVFHSYQWDLNYTNPSVFVSMLENIFFYANLGVDVLRIDAPAFIWKQVGTTCQNLPKAHTLLRLIKQCVMVATPGMALLGEAIVAPAAMINYFGTGMFKAQECDFAYNAAQMALQWDALATGEIKVMLAAQSILLQKPRGTSWITYTRCHDDIGLGYDDYMIEQAGQNAYEHRQFLKNYYSGNYSASLSAGTLFSYNPKTGDARISGSLASLCGLEKSMKNNDEKEIGLSIKKIVLMQAMSFFIGGMPMIFYGDEAAYTNDYSYLADAAKSYDNRWMHRPVINWKKNELINKKGTAEEQIFSATARLLSIRKKLTVTADHSNLVWMTPHNIHVAGFIRSQGAERLFCVFNFSDRPGHLTWYAFKANGISPVRLFDHWEQKEYLLGEDHEYLVIGPYSFLLLEEKVK